MKESPDIFISTVSPKKPGAYSTIIAVNDSTYNRTHIKQGGIIRVLVVLRYYKKCYMEHFIFLHSN